MEKRMNGHKNIYKRPRIDWSQLDLKKYYLWSACLNAFPVLISYPLKLVKTRMQIFSHVQEYKTTRSSFMHVLKTEGTAGLYKGFLVFGPGAVGNRVMQFATFEYCRSKAKAIQKEFLPDLHSTPFLSMCVTNTLSGALSGLFTMLVWTPTEVISQRQSVRMGRQSSSYVPIEQTLHFDADGKKNPLPPDFHVTKKNGSMWEALVDVYRGSGLALTLSVLFGATFFACTESIKHNEIVRSSVHELWGSEFWENITVSAIAGSVGGFGGAVVTSPLDVIKTIKQVHGIEQSSIKIFREVIQDQGVKGLFRGSVPRICTLTPSATISYSIFELAKHFSLKHDHF
eukprot:TRINITY_DN7354_c0_g1_i1.p1 TRINITY_DN7354_c0_g1~~TRINITY_DN7354_c0_g1_i1.p1  ORF type:complete len:342 (+),score=74.04 TRINITY_DN7354_c0_g1_i1:138-1163(+)